MAKGKGGNTVAAVRSIVEPYAEQLGLWIWDIRFENEGSDWFLRIFIDKEDGVDINDCVELTHAINKPLDEADPIDGSYTLEVSSPGLERELLRAEHFEACIGLPVKLRLIRPFEGERDYKGILYDYDDEGNITVDLGDEKALTFTKKEASWVKLDDFDE